MTKLGQTSCHNDSSCGSCMEDSCKNMSLLYILLVCSRPPKCSCNSSSLTAQHPVSLKKRWSRINEYFHTAKRVIGAAPYKSIVIYLISLCLSIHILCTIICILNERTVKVLLLKKKPRHTTFHVSTHRRLVKEVITVTRWTMEHKVDACRPYAKVLPSVSGAMEQPYRCHVERLQLQQMHNSSLQQV